MSRWNEERNHMAKPHDAGMCPMMEPSAEKDCKNAMENCKKKGLVS